jgi:hypothetical protein
MASAALFSPEYSPGRGLIACAWLAVVALALFPLTLVSLPALADLPDHLARVYILNHIAGNATLQDYYAVSWRLMHFQSTDILLPPLARLFGLEAAARIYIAAAFLLILGGTALLHRVLFGRVGLWPAAAALLLYNFMLAWGLVSVLFAFGLALILFAAWLASEDRAGILRSGLFALAALVLFLCHFFAFAVYAVLVAAHALAELRRPGGLRRGVLAAATLVVPSGIFLATLDPAAHSITQWGGVNDKIRMVMSPVTMYLARPDFVLGPAALLLVAVGRRLKLFRFAPPMKTPVLVVAALTILMPNQLSSIWGADFRLPTMLCLLLVAASDLRFRTPRQAIAALTAILILLGLRVGYVAHDWRAYQADFDALREAGAAIPSGARVLVVQSIDDLRPAPAPSLFPYRHAGSLLVEGHDIFLPQIFTSSTPLRLGAAGQAMESEQLAVLRDIHWQPKAAAFAAVDAETRAQAEAVGRAVSSYEVFTSTLDFSDWPERFDYLVDLDFGARRNPVPALLSPVAEGSYFAIYRIHPPGG